MSAADRMAAGPVAVLGAGSWGSALAAHLARRGPGVRLWGRNQELIARIRSTGENTQYLPGVRLPTELLVTGDPHEALGGAGLVLVAVPSHGCAGVCREIARAVDRDATLLSAVKGLEPERGRRISELLTDILPGRAVAVLSGPSFAREVALARPTALVIASTNESIARGLQRRLGTRELRLYTNGDVLGVELAGALKNVVAIATGLCDGLELGENARAALITRGLAEITRLGVALGASPATFAGLAGLGDLVLTCTGSLSRNRALGMAIGRGKTLAEAERSTPMVAEGVRTVSVAGRLAETVGVSMPICGEVAAVLFGGKPVRSALDSLLAREAKAEIEVAEMAP